MIATSFYDNTVNEYRLGEVNLHLGMAFVHAGNGRRSQNQMLYKVNRAKERAMDYRQMQKALAQRERKRSYAQYMRDTASTGFITGQTSGAFNPVSDITVAANDTTIPNKDNSAAWSNAATLFTRFADAMNGEKPNRQDYAEFILSLHDAIEELGSEEFIQRIRPLITAAQENNQAGFAMIMEKLAEEQTAQLEITKPQNTLQPPNPFLAPSPFMRAA